MNIKNYYDNHTYLQNSEARSIYNVQWHLPDTDSDEIDMKEECGDNFLYDTKLKTIDNTITEIKEINLEFWYFSINEFESASEIKPLLIRLFKFYSIYE